MPRRLRATFALRWRILASAVGLAGLALWPLGLRAEVHLIGALLVAYAAQELFLIELVEWWLVRRAARREGDVDTRWFVDLDARDARARADFERETRQNPSLR